uniref:Transglutaminase N-terminal domain-containing protein n=1 Tax=Cyprinodon variegatus TaxID=28743 RepID=A0A3Q2CFM9_CYPVA
MATYDIRLQGVRWGDLDLHCQTNNAAHKTNEISTKQLIVRRGQPFLMTLEMAYAFQPSEKVQLTVETGGAILIWVSNSAKYNFKAVWIQ